jgi:hypothetical protein
MSIAGTVTAIGTGITTGTNTSGVSHFGFSTVIPEGTSNKLSSSVPPTVTLSA